MKPALPFLLALTLHAQDSADTLARILAEKGTITAAELARVQQAAAGDRVSTLASILQQKGILTSNEVARLNPVPNAVETAQRSETQRNGTDQRTNPEPAAPPVTAQSRLPVTIYGTILVNSVYDTALMNISDIPLFTAKQGSDALGNDKSFEMTARQSRLGFRYESRGDLAGARLSGQVEIDFLGGKAPFTNGVNMDLIRLRLAFGRLDWKNFAIEGGQDWAIFAPLNPTSLAEYAIPSMSASGNLWIRLPQIRFEAKTPRVLAQFAAIDPDMGDYNTAVFSATRPPGIGERGRAPGAEVRIALTGKHDDRDFIVGFSGHYAHGKNAGAPNIQLPLDSWGVAVDYTLPFSKLFNLTGEAYTGRALGIFSDASGEAIQPVGTFGDRGVRTAGGWAQFQFNFTQKWQVNLVYGIDSPQVQDLPVGLRTRNQGYMGNLMYKYTPHATIAWEYRRLLTDFRNQPFANERGDTVNLALAYIF